MASLGKRWNALFPRIRAFQSPRAGIFAGEAAVQGPRVSLLQGSFRFQTLREQMLCEEGVHGALDVQVDPPAILGGEQVHLGHAPSLAALLSLALEEVRCPGREREVPRYN